MTKQKRKTEFLIVPKAPKGTTKDVVERVWRLSFQEQERELMKGNERLKPALRLMKKLRDTLNQSKISSYYLKTIFLTEFYTKKDDSQFWQSSLSFVFMHMLRKYQEYMEKGSIPYFWNNENDLLKGIDQKTLENFKFGLKKVIDNIDRKFDADPSIVAQYISTPEERAQLYEKFGKKSTDVAEITAVVKSATLMNIPVSEILHSSSCSSSESVINNCNNIIVNDNLISMIKLLGNNIISIQNDTKTILKKIVKIETVVDELKNDFKVELQHLKLHNQNTEQISSTQDKKDNQEFPKPSIIFPITPLVLNNDGLPDSTVEDFNPVVSANNFNELQNKLMILEKNIHDIQKENSILKAGLRQYFLASET